MHEVSHRLFFRVIFPNWMLRWGTPRMRRFMAAFDELEVRLTGYLGAYTRIY